MNYFLNTQINVSKTLLYGILISIVSCVPKKITITHISAHEQTGFFTFKLIKDSITNITSVYLTNLSIADTKINYKVEEDLAKHPNLLKIIVTYKNNKTVTCFIEHPLLKRFDIYSESGEIESKSISLQQGEVTIRIPYFESYSKIKIIETLNFIESKPIIIKNEE